MKKTLDQPDQPVPMQLKPIGHFENTNAIAISNKKLSAPRQSGMDRGQSGTIHILPAFRDGLKDLEGFDHIWVLFQFHLNQTWKPLVLPPRSSLKRGVFATRSPYRPNSIGMSCVKVTAIKDLKIQVTDTDLVDQTPIFDIKPYLAYCDSFPNASLGWTQEAELLKHTISIPKPMFKRIQWIQEQTSFPLLDTLHNQLEFDPLNAKKKRVKPFKNNQFIFSYRTWRVTFSTKDRSIKILAIESGYTAAEMKKQDDPYADKQIHAEFLKIFNQK